jgi:D-arabinose 5-phosphate isomerase GutQ
MGIDGCIDGLADDQICVLADHILSSPGTVVVSGVGKSRVVG